MKYLSITHIIPVLALLAVGCSSPMALQTSEYDDVYFASTDRVARPAEPAPNNRGVTRSENSQAEYGQQDYQTGDNEALNPEYSENTADADTYVTDNYYNETFASSAIRPRYVMPFNRFPSYNMMVMDPFFNPYHPFARRSFIDPYWGRSMMMYDPFYAYDPYMMRDPFMMYDPFLMGSRFGMGFNVGFGMGFGSGFGYGYNPYNPWGFGGMNSYHMGYNRGLQQGLYRQYYANNDAFRGQQTHYAPRTNRSVSPVTRDNNVGRPSLNNNNTGRIGPDGGRSATNVNNATGTERGRYERNVDQRNVNRRPEPTDRVEGSPARNERPVLMDRPTRSQQVQTDQISVPQDQQGVIPADRGRRSVETTRSAPEYRPQRPQPSSTQDAAPAQDYRRSERVRPARTESAPAQRPIYRESTPSQDFNRGRSSDTFSRPSMSSPSPSPSSSPSMGSPAGGRPRR